MYLHTHIININVIDFENDIDIKSIDENENAAFIY